MPIDQKKIDKEIEALQFDYLIKNPGVPEGIKIGYQAAAERYSGTRLIKVSDRFPPVGAPVYKKEGDDFLYVGRFTNTQAGERFSFAQETGNFEDCYWINY